MRIRIRDPESFDFFNLHLKNSEIAIFQESYALSSSLQASDLWKS